MVAQASKFGLTDKYQYTFTRARKDSIQSRSRECEDHSVHFPPHAIRYGKRGGGGKGEKGKRKGSGCEITFHLGNHFALYFVSLQAVAL